jgi:threonine aldolase
MDGARIANAVVALNTDFKTMTRGIDILSFGGTKNGLMHGEALIFFNKDLANNFKYYRKQTTQLASKMRYISAQFDYLLNSELWKINAQNSNNMAKYLEKRLLEIKNIEITQKVEVNSVFAIINNKEAIKKIQEEVFFYFWDERRNEVRLMTSYDTTKEDIDYLIDVMKKYL